MSASMFFALKAGFAMNNPLPERLKTLLGRLPYIGLDAGIAASSTIAAWGVYRFMLAGG